MVAYNNDVPFSALLATTMSEKGITDNELAKLLGKSLNVPGRWRNSHMIPGDEMLPLLVQHLGLDEDAWARSIRAERRFQKATIPELRKEVRELRSALLAIDRETQDKP